VFITARNNTHAHTHTQESTTLGDDSTGLQRTHYYTRIPTYYLKLKPTAAARRQFNSTCWKVEAVLDSVVNSTRWPVLQYLHIFTNLTRRLLRTEITGFAEDHVTYWPNHSIPYLYRSSARMRRIVSNSIELIAECSRSAVEI